MKADTQANLAYNQIRRKILISQLQSNLRLKEEDWATKLNVGRMAVREALTRLLGEGLVTIGEKGGYFVTEITARDIQEIRELREVLEMAALQLAMERITSVQLNSLDEICNDFSQMVEKGYFSGAREADIKFHETLVEASNNKRLLRAYYYSHIPLFHERLGRTKIYSDDYDLTNKEHRTIVEALRGKDLKLAQHTLLNHFRRGESALSDM